jgi:two-component sensor histidine kinase
LKKNSTSIILIYFLTVFIVLYVNVENVKSQNWLDSAKVAFEEQKHFLEASYYKKWLKNNKNPIDSTSIEVMLQLANSYRLNEDVKMALRAASIAKKYSEKMEDKYPFFKSTLYYAEVNRILQKQDYALSILDGMDRNQLENYPNLMAKYYHRRAAIFNEKNFYDTSAPYLDSALNYSLISLKYSEKINDLDAIGTSYNELANIFGKLYQFEKSILYYDKAIDILKDHNKANYFQAVINKGRMLWETAKYNECIELFLPIVDDIEKSGFTSLKYPFYFHLSESYKDIGDTYNYFIYQIKHLKSYTLWIEQNAQLEISKLAFEYEVEDKNRNLEIKELELIKQNQTRTILIILIIVILIILFLIVVSYYFINKKNKKLENLLKENQFLLGESNHRIKNNLQLIIALIALEDDESDTQESMTKLNDITVKIESIASLHQKLYTSEDKNLVELKSYLNDIISNLKIYFAKRKISISCNVEDVSLSVDKCMYLGLLTTELIINTLKHAFEKNVIGNIEINIQKTNKKIIFTYRDNGKGAENLDNMTLINLLSAQLKGEKLMENRQGFYYQLTINK